MKIKQKQKIIRDLVILSLSLILVILFWQNNLLTFFIILAVYLVRSHFWYETGDHTFFVVGGLLGTITEVVLISAGVYQYINPTILNIPIWLLVGWGLGSVLIIRIAQAFIKKD